MINEASFSVNGYVATQPKYGMTRAGDKTLYMRVGWTPRRLDRTTGEWADQPTSFVSVTCYRKVAENAGFSLRRGDAVVLKGTLRVREYGDGDGPKRNSVEVVADSIGHDLTRGVSFFRRSTAQLEQTAYELQQQVAAAIAEGRLSGDMPTADTPAGHPPGLGTGEGPADADEDVSDRDDIDADQGDAAFAGAELAGGGFGSSARNDATQNDSGQDRAELDDSDDLMAELEPAGAVA
jgi:single-strand DNA-binding protein